MLFVKPFIKYPVNRNCKLHRKCCKSWPICHWQWCEKDRMAAAFLRGQEAAYKSNSAIQTVIILLFFGTFLHKCHTHGMTKFMLIQFTTFELHIMKNKCDSNQSLSVILQIPKQFFLQFKVLKGQACSQCTQPNFVTVAKPALSFYPLIQ